MKAAQPELCVGLDGRMTRVARHWAAVDDLLQPAHPLLLLADESRVAFQQLAQQLPALRSALAGAEIDLKIAWGAYKRCKREMHRWLNGFNVWLRAYCKWTPYFAARQRVPGRGQSFEHWWTAAQADLSLWKNIMADPPPWPPGLNQGTPLRRPIEEFEAAVRAFGETWWALSAAELEVKIARGKVQKAQDRATELLMAYGHGVRARLGNKSELVKSFPQMWPQRKPTANRRIAA
jgi:hypothetical protein